MKMKSLILTVGLTMVLTASSWSLLRPGLFYIHDYVHASRIAEMSRMLLDGQIPPRWSQNFGFGYGMPLFQFYAPLPYFLGAILSWLNLSIEAVIKLLFFAASVLTAFGSYLLGKKFWGDFGGLFAAAAVTLAPYRALNLFVRGALSEAMGAMTFPWILLSIYLIIVEKRRGFWIVLAISLTCLVLSHNLSALIFSPVAFGFAVVLLLANSRKSFWGNAALWPLVKGFGLGILLPIFYVVPSLIEKRLTKVDEYIIGDYFDFGVHFVGLKQFFVDNWGYGGSAYGPNDSISFFLGYGQLAALVLAMMLVLFLILSKFIPAAQSFFQSKKLNQKYVLLLFFATISIWSLFMTHGKSTIIWTAIEPLKYLQFPWRFLNIATLFLVLFSGQMISLVKSAKLQTATFLILSCIIIVINWQYFAPREYLQETSELYYTDPIRIREEMSSVLPDYIPIGLSEDLPPAATPIFNPKPEIEVISDNSVQTTVRTNFSGTEGLFFSRADFPGWQVYINGNRVEKQVNEEGLIGVLVPAGGNQVQAVFESTAVRMVGDTISAFALAIFAILITLEFRRKSAHG